MRRYIGGLPPDKAVEIYATPRHCPYTPTFRVPASILSILSEKLATDIGALLSRQWRDEDEGILTMRSDDSAEAWGVLINWALKCELLTGVIKGAGVRKLMEYWLLADKKGAKDLQDATMLELLRPDGQNNLEYDIGDITYAFDNFISAPPLRRFMAEVAVRAIEVEEWMCSGDLKDLRGEEDFTQEIMKVYRRFSKYGREIFDQFAETDVSKVWWKKFMVAGGPKQHWVHQKAAHDGDEEHLMIG